MDPLAAARWRGRAREESPWLHEEIGHRMVDRLGWIKQQPEAWLDWAPVLGGLQAHRQIRALYPQARAWVGGEQAEQAVRLLRQIESASQTVWRGLKRWLGQDGLRAVGPGAVTEPVDMLWANMALHQTPDPKALLTQWRDALKTGGFLMFSALGPDTLREVRQVYAAQGWSAPAPAHTDMHDWGDMLVEVGFAEPVMDMERLTLTYSTAERLLQDLRDTGRNVHSARFAALRGRRYRQSLLEALEAGLSRDAQGQLQVTVEVLYGHAMKAPPRVKVAESSAVSVQDMKTMLRQSAGRQGRRPD